MKLPVQEFDFLSVDETDRFVKAAPEDWRAMLVFVLKTGARVGDALALRWADVDLVAGKVVIRRTL